MAVRRRWIVGSVVAALAAAAALALLARPTGKPSSVGPQVLLTSAQLPRGWSTSWSHTGSVREISYPACRRAAHYLFGNEWATGAYHGKSSEVFEVAGSTRWAQRTTLIAALGTINRLRMACASEHGLSERLRSPCVPLAAAVGMASLRDDSAYVPLELWLPTSVGLASTALQAGRGEVTSIAQEGAQQSAIAATYLVHGRFALVVAIMNGSQMRAPAILTEVLKHLSL